MCRRRFWQRGPPTAAARGGAPRENPGHPEKSRGTPRNPGAP
ncbi:hypothetical protein YT1_4730 [Rhodococcus ruber]|nr:hypothetical protein YT1_4730 [Rhodococcus ruber]